MGEVFWVGKRKWGATPGLPPPSSHLPLGRSWPAVLRGAPLQRLHLAQVVRRVDVPGLPSPAVHLPLHVVGAVDLFAVVDGALEGVALGAEGGGGVGGGGVGGGGVGGSGVGSRRDGGLGFGCGFAVVAESFDEGGEGLRGGSRSFGFGRG